MKKINIKIHKHTKVRYRKSGWVTQLICGTGLSNNIIDGYFVPTVTDLQRVPKIILPSRPVGGKRFAAIYLDEYDKITKNTVGGTVYPTKKLGFWRNLWQNKIRKR